MKKQFKLTQKFMPKKNYTWMFAAGLLGLFSQCQSEQTKQSKLDTTPTTDTIKVVEESYLTKVVNNLFEIKVFGVDTLHAVYTNSGHLVLGNNPSEKFISLDTEYKNVGSAVGEIKDGELTINQNGKAHKFNNLIIVLADGYNTSLDKIRPNDIKRGKLLYKVPRKLTGTATWKPDSTSNVVELGDIK
ncbi:MAG: hypothetical protein EOO99_10155 [Pedobacter sp.]|nr:MAG: hypothetical protein EOO99_10155 [Pedobacter sp.]